MAPAPTMATALAARRCWGGLRNLVRPKKYITPEA